MKLEWQNSIILLVFLLPFNIYGQISGYVFDTINNKPIESCNIFQKTHSNITTTDKDGKFSINVELGSKITFSSLGYNTIEITVIKKNLDTIYLSKLSKKINEVKIKIKEDPAIKIIKTAIRNKKKNTGIPIYRKEILKINLYDVNELSPFKKSDIFKKYSDSLKESVPFFISLNDYKNDSLINEFSKGIAINKKYFKDYINSLYIDFDIENEKINILNRNITSPFSIDALRYYDYYLHDSVFIDNQFCYKIKLKPKNKNNVLFSGFVWINKSIYQIQSAKIFLDNTYLNFIKNINIEQEYIIKNKKRKLERKKVRLCAYPPNLNILDTLFLKVNHEQKWFKIYPIHIEKDSLESDFKIIKNINEDPKIKIIAKFSETLIDQHYKYNKIDFGPIYETLTKNKFEGQRISLNCRTNKEFHKNSIISAYYGYGTKDKITKYGLQIKLRNKELNSFQIVLNSISDIEYLHNPFIDIILFPNKINYASEDLLYSLFKRSETEEMIYYNKNEFSISKEIKNINISISFGKKYIQKNKQLRIQKNISQNIGRLNFKYSLQKKIKSHFDIINTINKYPVVFGQIDYIQNIQNNKHTIKLRFATVNTVNTSIYGKTKYLLNLGLIKNYDYSSIYNLEINRGNESYIYRFDKSSLMNMNEFFCDRYCAFYLENNYEGRIINNIPVINKLNLRELITANIIIGNLHDKNNLKNLPEFISPLSYTNPYVEAGFALDNIFKILRLHAIWRLSHLTNKNTIKYGVFGSINITI